MSHRIRLVGIPTMPIQKISKEEAQAENIVLIEKLSKIQNRLYAQKKYSVLIIL